MDSLPKALITAGAILIMIGLFWQFGGKLFHFGRLPGDIAIEKEHFKFYFPLGTSVLISLILSGILYLIRMLSK